MIKEFELTLKLRNNCLKARRVALGYKSAVSFANATGVHPTSYCAYETLKKSPLKRLRGGNYIWTPSAKRIAAFHGCAPKELWPDAILAVKQSTAVAEIEADKVLALAGFAATLELPATPEDLCSQVEGVSGLESALATLPRRIQEAVRLRYGLDGEGERSLEEIGNALACKHRTKIGSRRQTLAPISRERARMLVADGERALRKRMEDLA